MVYQMKPLFEERMKKLLGREEDFESFRKIVHTGPRNFIRCNTLKISPKKLLGKLRKRWDVEQLFKDFPEIMLVLTDLGPGELGNAIEHLLGYFYVQEVSSMMSVLALDPKPGEFVLDLCASPGSKTTQISARMKNKGTIIANDKDLNRVKILAANLERAGVSNAIVTRNDGVQLCEKFAKKGWKFDKILLDVPCSGEGTLRSSPKTFLMWNFKVVNKLAREQKKLFASAIKCLKVGGEMVYSTCTHAPEENEEVIDFALKNFPVEIQRAKLPLKCRPGLKTWEGRKFNEGAEKACRIYPQDNDSEGFFVTKLRLKEEVR